MAFFFLEYLFRFRDIDVFVYMHIGRKNILIKEKAAREIKCEWEYDTIVLFQFNPDHSPWTSV